MWYPHVSAYTYPPAQRLPQSVHGYPQASQLRLGCKARPLEPRGRRLAPSRREDRLQVAAESKSRGWGVPVLG